MATPVKLRAEVREVIHHAEDVRSLVLVPEGRVPRFKPGYFLHLAVDEYDPSSHWPESRVFSIASSPEERSEIRITFSKVGKFTTRMLALKPGDHVWLKLPYGEFVVGEHEGMEVALIGGGTGITPFVSLLSSSEIANPKIRVFYGARNPALLMYANTIRAAAKRLPEFKYRLYCEDGAAQAGPGILAGRTNLDDALKTVDQPMNTVWYLAGPPKMIDMFRDGLSKRGVPAEQIRVDAWE